MNLRATVAIAVLASTAFAATTSSSVETKRYPPGLRTSMRMELDIVDPERKAMTIDRVTTSGARVIWTYSPVDTPRNY